MIIKKGNIWNYWEKGYWIIIPTNGFVKKNGRAVMGRGLALQAKNRFSYLNFSTIFGKRLKMYGNKVWTIPEIRLITFPVKHNWWEIADLELIEKSAEELKFQSKCIFGEIYLPKVGCGNGKLNWKEVEPILDAELDDRFVIVDLK